MFFRKQYLDLSQPLNTRLFTLCFFRSVLKQQCNDAALQLAGPALLAKSILQRLANVNYSNYNAITTYYNILPPTIRLARSHNGICSAWDML